MRVLSLIVLIVSTFSVNSLAWDRPPGDNLSKETELGTFTAKRSYNHVHSIATLEKIQFESKDLGSLAVAMDPERICALFDEDYYLVNTVKIDKSKVQKVAVFEDESDEPNVRRGRGVYSVECNFNPTYTLNLKTDILNITDDSIELQGIWFKFMWTISKVREESALGLCRAMGYSKVAYIELSQNLNKKQRRAGITITEEAEFVGEFDKDLYIHKLKCENYNENSKYRAHTFILRHYRGLIDYSDDSKIPDWITFYKYPVGQSFEY